MNKHQIAKRLEVLEQTKIDKNKRKPFSTLEKFKSGELTGEEALAILDDGNESFSYMQKIIIKSGMYDDDEKKAKK